MLFKTIVFLFAAAFIAKILFFKNREKFSRIANQFANLFLVAIAVYIVIYGGFQLIQD